MIPRSQTRFEFRPYQGDVEFRIDIDGRAAITAHAKSPEGQDVIYVLEQGDERDLEADDSLVIDEG